MQRVPATTVSTMDNPFGHQGLAFDAEIGSYQNRHRQYAPKMKRFMQRDPLNTNKRTKIAYLDGMNTYGYLGRNPVLRVDASGLAGANWPKFCAAVACTCLARSDTTASVCSVATAACLLGGEIEKIANVDLNPCHAGYFIDPWCWIIGTSQGCTRPADPIDPEWFKLCDFYDGFTHCSRNEGCYGSCAEAWSLDVLPKSSVGKAVSYMLNQWRPLTAFLTDPSLPLDNNASERAMRHVVIGRNNWMFAGSVAGGHRAAIIYSVVATCKLNALAPFAYLRYAIERLAQGDDPATLLPGIIETEQLAIGKP